MIRVNCYKLSNLGFSCKNAVPRFFLAMSNFFLHNYTSTFYFIYWRENKIERNIYLIITLEDLVGYKCVDLIRVFRVNPDRDPVTTLQRKSDSEPTR